MGEPTRERFSPPPSKKKLLREREVRWTEERVVVEPVVEEHGLAPLLEAGHEGPGGA